jgi:type IV secretory pathway VirB4 component
MKRKRIINLLDKSKVVSKEELQSCLSRDTINMGNPSLDILTSNPSKEYLLNELADIFVESILGEIHNGK